MTKNVIVSTEIEVSVDPEKFTPQFMENFNKYFHEKETIDDHIKYIAELYARGAFTSENEEIEGYGKLKHYGIYSIKTQTV